MPSPFPGMDPFIEGQLGGDFHLSMISVIREALVPQLIPGYQAQIKQRACLEQTGNGTSQIRPDVSVWETGPGGSASAGATATLEPAILNLPEFLEWEEGYIEIRRRSDKELITVIEVLSPTNKSQNGRQEYLKKRRALSRSSVHLVELDLLRGGQRLPMNEELPPADYYAFVGREEIRPKAEVYSWTLNHVLPIIPIPLSEDDPDVMLNLQEVLNTVYDRAAYQISLDYERGIEPGLDEARQAWGDVMGSLAK